MTYIVIATGANGDSVECVGSGAEASTCVTQLLEDGWTEDDITVYHGRKLEWTADIQRTATVSMEEPDAGS